MAQWVVSLLCKLEGPELRSPEPHRTGDSSVWGQTCGKGECKMETGESLGIRIGEQETPWPKVKTNSQSCSLAPVCAVVCAVVCALTHIQERTHVDLKIVLSTVVGKYVSTGLESGSCHHPCH